MSSNSSRPAPTRRARVLSLLSAIFATITFSSWALLSVFGIGGIIGSAMYFGGTAQLGIDIDATSALSLAVLSVLVYIVGAAILLIEPYAIRRMTFARVRELLGLARRPVLKDLGRALLGWGAYMLLTFVVVGALTSYAPTVDLDQQQDVGFKSLLSNLDILYAFIVIVVIAPIVEEIVFRGYIFGSLRPRMPWWLAAIIVSVLFGLIHGQLNVGIDTFLLSMVVCYLREKTGAIWSGIAVHAIKNSIAFYILFVAPEWIKQLLMTV